MRAGVVDRPHAGNVQLTEFGSERLSFLLSRQRALRTRQSSPRGGPHASVSRREGRCHLYMLAALARTTQRRAATGARRCMGGGRAPAGGEEKQPQPQPPPPLTRPSEPGPEDCCNSGCEKCVWEVYYADLKAFEEANGGAGMAPNPQPAAPSLSAFAALEARLAAEAAAKAGSDAPPG